MKKIFNYFFIKPANKLLFYLTIKFNKSLYCYFFNFYSLLFSNKTKIQHREKFFYINENNYTWRFFHKHQGLMAYSQGLIKRGLKLKEEYLIKNIDFNENDEVIDCGANNGDFFLCFNKKINYTGIEPSKIEYLNLHFNIKNQSLINKALYSNSNSYLDFYISGEYGDSSLIKINVFEEIYKVETITLDDIIDKISRNIKLIKIEAEGAEPEVLQGLKKNLSKIEYITIDCGFERGLKKESTLVACVNYLLDNNYELIDFTDKRIVCLFRNKLFKK